MKKINDSNNNSKEKFDCIRKKRPEDLNSPIEIIKNQENVDAINTKGKITITDKKPEFLLKENNIDDAVTSSEKTNIKPENKIIGYPSDKKEEKKTGELNSQNINNMEGIYESNKSENIKMKDTQKIKKDNTSIDSNNSSIKNISGEIKKNEYSKTINDDFSSINLNESEDEISNGEIIIKYKGKKKDKDKVLEEVKEIIRTQKFKLLIDYTFPYMQQNEFNSKIGKLDNDLFRSLLFFYCPECKVPLRHYSMPFHIFEFHFEYINKYLNHKDIANGCAKLMNNEYNKIKNALENFSELAIVFKNCNFRGQSIWRNEANEQIDDIVKLNVFEQYFKRPLGEALRNLEKKLPMNKNKNNGRKFKSIEKTLIKYELKSISK